MTVNIKGLKGWVIFDEDSKIVTHHKLNRNSYNSSMNGKGQNPPTVCTKSSQTDYVDAMTSLSKLVKYIYWKCCGNEHNVPLLSSLYLHFSRTCDTRSLEFASLVQIVKLASDSHFLKTSKIRIKNSENVWRKFLPIWTKIIRLILRQCKLKKLYAYSGNYEVVVKFPWKKESISILHRHYVSLMHYELCLSALCKVALSDVC